MGAVSFLIGIISAIWVYQDASKRKEQFAVKLIWALGSCVMPVVCLPLYLMFGRKEKMVTSAQTDAITIDVEATPVEETALCPMCGKKIKKEFSICPYCGHSVKPKCPNCGKEVMREWGNCPNCQTELKQK